MFFRLPTNRQLCAVLVWLSLPAVGFAQDVSELFLRAYQDYQAGERLESDANYAEALAKFQAAQKQLKRIVDSSPDWQPLVVEYRLRKTSESIARVTPRAAEAGKDFPEGPLPEADRQSASPLVGTPSRPAAVESFPQGGSAIQRELSNLRKQLAAAQRRSEELALSLDEKNAELQKAIREKDKTKITLVEMKSQLAQMSQALENAKKDTKFEDKSYAKLEQQVKALAEHSKRLSAENEVLEEENAKLLEKLDRAAAYISAVDLQREALIKERDKAFARTKKIKDNSEALEKVKAELAKAKEENTKLAKAAKDKGTDDKRVAELEKKLKSALAENAGLRRLSEQNDVLEAKLREVGSSMARAIAASEGKEVVIDELQIELNSVKDQLLTAQSEIQQGETKVDYLEKQLDRTTGELASLKLNGGGRPDDATRMAEENELLRGILAKEMEKRAKTADVREVLEGELLRLQAKSDVLDRQLAALKATEIVVLSDREKAILKQPMISEASGDSETMKVSIAAYAKRPDAKPGDGVSQAATLTDEQQKRFAEGREKLANRELEKAEQVFQKLAEETPENYEVLFDLAVAQFQLGRLQAAEVALRKAIGLDGRNPRAFTTLGIVHYRQGRFSEAIDILERAVDLDGKDFTARNYLGIAFAKQGEMTKAEREIARAVEIEPGYADAHFNLALLYATAKPPDLNRARESYLKAKELGSPADPYLDKILVQPHEPQAGLTGSPVGETVN